MNGGNSDLVWLILLVVRDDLRQAHRCQVHSTYQLELVGPDDRRQGRTSLVHEGGLFVATKTGGIVVATKKGRAVALVDDIERTLSEPVMVAFDQSTHYLDARSVPIRPAETRSSTSGFTMECGRMPSRTSAAVSA